MWENEYKVQFFWTCLLALLAGRPCFRLTSLVGLVVGLAIGEAELTDGKIAISFPRWSL